MDVKTLRERIVGAMPWYDESSPDFTELDAILFELVDTVAFELTDEDDAPVYIDRAAVLAILARSARPSELGPYYQKQVERQARALKRIVEVLDQSGGDRYAIEARGIARAALPPADPSAAKETK